MKDIFKKIALHIAVTVNIGDIVNKIATKNPHLVTTELMEYAVIAGNDSSVSALIKAKPLDFESSDRLIKALGKIDANPHKSDYDDIKSIRQSDYDDYKKMTNTLLNHNLIQKEGQFSELLKIHNEKSYGAMDNNFLEIILKNKKHTNSHQISSEEVTKAVVDNIGNTTRQSISWLSTNNYLQDKGAIYPITLNGTDKEVKVGLIGLAALASNSPALEELERNRFSLSFNDIIATKDFAAHSNSIYLREEHVTQRANSRNGISAKEMAEIRFFHTPEIPNSFSKPSSERFQENKDSVIYAARDIIRPNSLINTGNSNVHIIEKFLPEEIKNMARNSEKVNVSQDNRASPEMKEEVNKFITARYRDHLTNNFNNRVKNTDTEISLTINKDNISSSKDLNASKSRQSAFKHN